MNIFIGNLSRQVTDADLREAFEAHGAVASSNVIKDKFTGESRGFGFVEMAAQAEAEAAIAALNGQDLKGRALNVAEAKPRTEGGGGARAGGGYGGGGNRAGGAGGGGHSRRKPARDARWQSARRVPRGRARRGARGGDFRAGLGYTETLVEVAESVWFF